MCRFQKLRPVTIVDFVLQIPNPIVITNVNYNIIFNIAWPTNCMRFICYSYAKVAPKYALSSRATDCHDLLLK